MKPRIFSLALISAFTVGASTSMAAQLTDAQMDKVVAGNYGHTTTTTTAGRYGQLKNGNTNCNNCTTTKTTDKPGKNRSLKRLEVFLCRIRSVEGHLNYALFKIPTASDKDEHRGMSTPSTRQPLEHSLHRKRSLVG